MIKHEYSHKDREWSDAICNPAMEQLLRMKGYTLFEKTTEIEDKTGFGDWWIRDPLTGEGHGEEAEAKKHDIFLITLQKNESINVTYRKKNYSNKVALLYMFQEGKEVQSKPKLVWQIDFPYLRSQPDGWVTVCNDKQKNHFLFIQKDERFTKLFTIEYGLDGKMISRLVHVPWEECNL